MIHNGYRNTEAEWISPMEYLINGRMFYVDYGPNEEDIPTELWTSILYVVCYSVIKGQCADLFISLFFHFTSVSSPEDSQPCGPQRHIRLSAQKTSTSSTEVAQASRTSPSTDPG